MNKFILASGEKIIANESGLLVLDSNQIDGLPVLAEFPCGEVKGDQYYLLLLPDGELPSMVNESELIGLRSCFAFIESATEYQLLASAAQITTWYHSFRFCPRCAYTLRSHQHELAKVCDQCGHHQYPRISPCIIVLVTDGEKCLLAHGRRFAPGRYSTLAGFIEAGETPEQAVEREVMEEVAVKVKNIRYSFSQSWPFPHSLMIGYQAEYAEGDIQPDGEEILDADWFSIDELPQLPPKFTIARRLIDQFLLEKGRIKKSESAALFATK